MCAIFSRLAIDKCHFWHFTVTFLNAWHFDIFTILVPEQGGVELKIVRFDRTSNDRMIELEVHSFDSSIELKSRYIWSHTRIYENPLRQNRMAQLGYTIAKKMQSVCSKKVCVARMKQRITPSKQKVCPPHLLQHKLMESYCQDWIDDGEIKKSEIEVCGLNVVP